MHPENIEGDEMQIPPIVQSHRITHPAHDTDDGDLLSV
jgi:hypothetical protein